MAAGEKRMNHASMRDIYDSASVSELLQRFAADRIRDRLFGKKTADEAQATGEWNETVKLHVLAITALSDALGSPTDLADHATATAVPREGKRKIALSPAEMAFNRWSSLIDQLVALGATIASDDLVFLVAAAYKARRVTQLRACLRRPEVRKSFEIDEETAAGLPWPQRVKQSINLSLLLLVLQSTRVDVQQADGEIRKLMALQKECEAAWLEQDEPDSDRAMQVAALYHLAHLVVRTARFLLHGEVTDGHGTVRDILREQERILGYVRDLALAAPTADLLLWLQAVAVAIYSLRDQSVWVRARHISPKIEQFISTLVEAERDQYVLSLLPSQQEALRGALLDPARVAVVLEMPTSAGKTLLAEFAVVQAIGLYGDSARVAYIAPTRALVAQARRTLSEDLRGLGIRVATASAAVEEDPYELHLLDDQSGVMISTPEKFDLLLRRRSPWLEDLRLVIVDEAHLLGESGARGVSLELLLANLRRECPQARLLLLTPFVENAKEIAEWLAGDDGLDVSVRWRPSPIIVGLAHVSGRRPNRALRIKWRDPWGAEEEIPNEISIPTTVSSADLNNQLKRTAHLVKQFQRVGSVLALFPGSRTRPEKLAYQIAQERTPATGNHSGELEVALALTAHDFGKESPLYYCLERGVAFHHAGVSDTLRYLVERMVRSGTVDIIASTTTLAQGMNFPVATVVVDSVTRPDGHKHVPLSSAEFWNIAGRAGRVGLVDRGMVVFPGSDFENAWDHYCKQPANKLLSGLLQIADLLDPKHLAHQQREHAELRSFLRYLLHAAALETPQRAIAQLEELLNGSLASRQQPKKTQALRNVALTYIVQELQSSGKGKLRAIDETGFGSFSFDQLYASMKADDVLSKGPMMLRQATGLAHLIEALRWLPEMEFLLGWETGEMNPQTVAAIVDHWISGGPVHELGRFFPGSTPSERISRASTYINRTVSMNLAWGAHAYLRCWRLASGRQQHDPADMMLPAYIQHGVSSPEAALASVLGVPRAFAAAAATVYQDQHGNVTPEDASKFRDFMETADNRVWEQIVGRSGIEVESHTARAVVRGMQGLPE